MLLFFRQEISVVCPGRRQQLSGCEAEESGADGEGPERSRSSHRAQPASQRRAGRSGRSAALKLILSDFVFQTRVCHVAPASLPGVLKADVIQGPLLSLCSSSSEQASTSKQQYSVEQQLYGVSGIRDDIFSLVGSSYITGGKNCGSRTLG